MASIRTVGERRCAAAIEQHPQICGSVEPGVGALMPDVLANGDELRQAEMPIATAWESSPFAVAIAVRAASFTMPIALMPPSVSATIA